MKVEQSDGARAGMLLIECVVYMVIFFILSGVAYEALFHCWDGSAAFGRDARDITRSLEAGERWRADVRAASGPIVLTKTSGGEVARIPEAGGEVVYTWSGAELRRRGGPDPHEVVELADVKSSRMESQAEASGTAWRWELELASKRHTGMRPLFSFAAVAPEGRTHEH